MIHVAQDDDHESIIVARFSQGWSLDELVHALDEIYLLADSIPEPIYLIFNLLDAPTLPKVSLSSLRNISLRIHPHIKLIIDVTESSLVTIMTNLFKAQYREGDMIHVVSSCEEAHQLILYDSQT